MVKSNYEKMYSDPAYKRLLKKLKTAENKVFDGKWNANIKSPKQTKLEKEHIKNYREYKRLLEKHNKWSYTWGVKK